MNFIDPSRSNYVEPHCGREAYLARFERQRSAEQARRPGRRGGNGWKDRDMISRGVVRITITVLEGGCKLYRLQR